MRKRHRVIHCMMDVQDTRNGRANFGLFFILVSVVVVVTRIHIWIHSVCACDVWPGRVITCLVSSSLSLFFSFSSSNNDTGSCPLKVHSQFASWSHLLLPSVKKGKKTWGPEYPKLKRTHAHLLCDHESWQGTKNVVEENRSERKRRRKKLPRVP